MTSVGKAFSRFLLALALLVGAPAFAFALTPAPVTSGAVAAPPVTAPSAAHPTAAPSAPRPAPVAGVARPTAPAASVAIPAAPIAAPHPVPTAIAVHAPAASASAVPHVTPVPTAAPVPTAVAVPHPVPTAAPATLHVGAPAAQAAPPAPATERQAWIAAGKDLVQRQVERTQKLLPSTGYTSMTDLENAVAAMGPARAKVVQLLKEEKFEFVMATHEQTREGIAAKGFLNQYDVGRSSGTYSPDSRANVESSFVGMSRADYDKLPASVRPKYGYLRPASESGVRMSESSVSQYGSDAFVFKPSAVRDHLTFYPNDSLGYSARGWPVQPGAPEATEWHHALLPWADRMLLAPQLQVSEQGELQFAQAPAGFKNYAKKWGDRYLEIQIWRPLGLQDVERFEFQTTPPAGEFLNSLRQNGVKIFQRGSATEWTGDKAAVPHAVLRLLRRRVVVDEWAPTFAEAA